MSDGYKDCHGLLSRHFAQEALIRQVLSASLPAVLGAATLLSLSHLSLARAADAKGPAPTVMNADYFIEQIDCSCAAEPYLANGNKRYICKFKLTNQAAPSNPEALTLAPNPSWSGGSTAGSIHSSAGSIVFNTSAAGCATNTNPSPLGINQTWSPCVDLTVGAGVTSTVLSVYGATTPSGDPEPESKTVKLPSCVSSVCVERPLRVTESSAAPSVGGGITSINIRDTLSIPGNPALKSLSAEIAYFEHRTPDDCRSCAKKSDERGFFLVPQSRLSSPATGWPAGGQPSVVAPYRLLWKPASGTASATFPASGQQVNLTIRVPDTTLASCCPNKYKVCIRYNYTDANCRSCNVLKCHEASYGGPGSRSADGSSASLLNGQASSQRDFPIAATTAAATSSDLQACRKEVGSAP